MLCPPIIFPLWPSGPAADTLRLSHAAHFGRGGILDGHWKSFAGRFDVLAWNERVFEDTNPASCELLGNVPQDFADSGPVHAALHIAEAEPAG